MKTGFKTTIAPTALSTYTSFGAKYYSTIILSTDADIRNAQFKALQEVVYDGASDISNVADKKVEKYKVIDIIQSTSTSTPNQVTVYLGNPITLSDDYVCWDVTSMSKEEGSSVIKLTNKIEVDFTYVISDLTVRASE